MKKKKLLLGIVSIFAYALIITGGSYAYFSYRNSNSSVVTGEAATIDADLKVERVVPVKTTTNLVPLLDKNLDIALKGTRGVSACVDANSNLSCEVYKITLTNTGSTNLRLSGSITLNATGSNNIFRNLKWELLEDVNARKQEYLTNSLGTSILDENINISSKSSKTYYIALWLSETNKDQSNTDYGKYGGLVEFTDANGLGVTATFKEFDKDYCTNNKINNFSDCLLLSEKYSSSVNDAKTYISNKTANFNNIAPLTTYEERKETNLTGTNFISVVEKIRFGTSYRLDASSGRYYLSNTKLGVMTDYLSTDSKKYYTCGSTGTDCTTMYVVYSATSSESNGTTTYKATKVDRYTIQTLESNLSEQGLYKTTDNYGDSYYYRGKVTNNYVSFAGYIWRIIRINGDGSIRLMYSGTSTSDTGSKTSIGTTAYNSYPYDASSVGYKYGKNLVLKHSTQVITYGNINNGTTYYFGTSYTTDDINKKLSISGNIKSGTLDEIWKDGHNKDYKYTCFSTSQTGTCASLVEIQSYVNPNQVRAKYHSYLTDTYENTYTDEYDSDAKKKIDAWYKTNIGDKGYGKYLSDTLFCNDRTYTSGDGSSLNATTIYGAYNRNADHKTPTLNCSRQVDQFTTSKGSSIGNGELTYPVGLITMDEAVMAGGKAWNINTSSWLTTGQPYWTASPSQFNAWNAVASVWRVNSDGTLNDSWTSRSWLGVRPVINLKSDLLITKGNGTASSPYIIGTDN